MSGSTSMAEVPPAKGASAFSFGRCWGPILWGILACACVHVTLGVSPRGTSVAEGPGLTFDEGFNVEMGVYLVRGMQAYGWGALHPQSLMEIYSHPAYNPDHPPLGRLILGAAHELLGTLYPDSSPAPLPYSVDHARYGSALAWGATVVLAAWAAAQWYGRRAGMFAPLALLLIPRLFAHAHLAALETSMGLTYLLAVVVIAECWAKKPRLRWWDGIVPGVMIGLAFLTKMQAVVLPPVVLLWALWHWRLRAVVPLAVLGVTALAVFYLGWPWLWLDPVEHFQEYFLRATDRQVVYCYYGGERYADRDVPWHYPFVIFLITTPLTLLLFAAWGLLAKESIRRQDVSLAREPAERTGALSMLTRLPDRWASTRALLLFAALAPLLLFALPGVAVYDGERLFLIAWPPLAIVMGRGADAAWNWLRGRCSRFCAVTVALLALVLTALSTALMHPCQLSYYNVLVGWLPGAERLGMEVSYWGDGVTGSFLEEAFGEIPPGSVIDVTPVLHPLQLEFMRTQQIGAIRPDVQLRGFDPAHLPEVRYVLAIRRRADTWELLRSPPAEWEPLAQSRRLGVPLATLYKVR